MEVNIKNIYDILSDIPQDKLAGVKLVRISGEGSSCIFGAELESGAVLKAHYHLEGNETYYVIEGICTMKLSKPESDDNPQTERNIQIKKGDVINIEENTVHSLRNGESVTRLIIVCPENHAGSDRYFMEDLNEKL